MSQTIDRGTLDRLIALGRARGALTADDLQAALPVDRMDVDALVLVMLELDAAGVDVEPDAFGPPIGRPVPAAPIRPGQSPGTPPPVGAIGAPAVAPEPAPVRPDALPEREPDEGRAVTRAVALAGLVTLLVRAAMSLLL